jgi:hypothetical protein
MRIRSLIVAACLLVTAPRATLADITPLDEKIPEDKPTSITCALPATDASIFNTKIKLEAAEYHYTVYLPPGYHESKHDYPCLFIASPGGRAAPGPFKDRLAKDKWIAVGLTESKNGPWEPIVGNFIAAHDDAIKRFRIAKGFMVMTGFSGGARASSLCTSLRPGFGGVILQGAGFAENKGQYYTATLQTNPGIAIYGVYGIGDGNNSEAAPVNALLTPANLRRFTLQEGGHAAAKKESFDEALDFIQDAIYVRRKDAKPAPKNADDPLRQQYEIRIKLLTDRAAASEGLEKYEALEMASKIETARLSTKALGTQVKELAAKPEVAKELAARAAYQKIRDSEDTNWIKESQPAKLTAFTKQAAAAYEAMAKKHEDTVYGKKAEARAAWLTKGVEKPEKPAKPEKPEKP